MSSPATAGYWLVLLFAVAIVAAAAVGVGYLYGRLARNRSDERAVRGTNRLAVGTGVFVGIGVGFAGSRAGTDATTAFGGVLADLGGALVGGVAAAIVGAAAITGIAAAHPDLPSIDDVGTARRQYARYLAGIVFVVLLLVPAVELAARGGPAGITAVVAAVGVGFWAAGPVHRSLTAATRAPSDAERDRLEALREAAGLEVRTVRVLEDGGDRVSVELLGVPGRRVLFVSSGALEALDDETLTALAVARREQAAHYEQPAAIAVLVAAAAALSAWLGGELSGPIGVGATALIVCGGLAGLRRLRYRSDDCAAERVGADALATAFERACEAAGFDLEDSGRRWLSTTPSMAARIERLRTADAESAADGRSG